MSARTPGVSGTVVRWCAVGVVVAACAGALLVGVGTMQRAAAQSTAVKLVGATPFAVLASGTVTAAGTPSITGDVGGSTVTGLDGRVKGAVSTGAGTAQALADLGTADDTVASSAVTAALSGDVGGTLRPGTYGATGSIDIPGRLVLDAGGDADAMFIIKTDAAFLTGSGTSITLAGGARGVQRLLALLRLGHDRRHRRGHGLRPVGHHGARRRDGERAAAGPQRRGAARRRVHARPRRLRRGAEREGDRDRARDGDRRGRRLVGPGDGRFALVAQPPERHRARPRERHRAEQRRTRQRRPHEQRRDGAQRRHG